MHQFSCEHKFEFGDRVFITYRDGRYHGEIAGMHFYVTSSKVVIRYVVIILEWDNEMGAFGNIDEKWYAENQIEYYGKATIQGPFRSRTKQRKPV